MIEKELTWNELADYYDKYCRGGRPARTLPMEIVWNWAANRKDLFYVNEDRCICLKEVINHEQNRDIAINSRKYSHD